jgi:hypothetical protein
MKYIGTNGSQIQVDFAHRVKIKVEQRLFRFVATSRQCYERGAAE